MFFSRKYKDILSGVRDTLVHVHLAVHRIEKDQIQIKEKLRTMATQAELEQAVQDVKSSVTTAFANIDAAVVGAADRVIATINAGGDPAAQIAELEALKESVSTQASAEVDKINAIDPATPAPEPAPAPTEPPPAE